jgi:hypothetical protein
MARNNRRTESPETALLLAVDAIGSAQEVGTYLRPEYAKTPDDAGRWLSHCLDHERRDKLSPRQIVAVFRKAFEADEHAGFESFAKQCGYEAKPLGHASQLQHLRQKAEQAAKEAAEASRDLNLLLENPDLLARMEAAGLRVGEL